MAIINISISVDTSQVPIQRILDGMGYQATIDGQANPESGQAFIKRRIQEFIRNRVQATENTTAVNTAVATPPAPLPLS